MSTEQANGIATELRRVRRVEVEIEAAQMPNPDILLAKALEEPPLPQSLCAADYGNTIQRLRDLGYTWAEVHEWMNAHGVLLGYQSFIFGWRTWKARNPT